MQDALQELLQILVRWTHVITAIMWIGDSLLFMWLDSHMYQDAEQRPTSTGITWLIHGGGYYTVEKRPLKAGALPPRLRWFWMEATGTWLSGFLLLMMVYWLSAGSNMVDQGVRALTAGQAVGISLGSILGAWAIYDSLWRTPLRKQAALCSALTLGLLLGLDWFLTHTLSGRAAFLQMGAVMASLMAFNVWVHIIPPQRKMYAQAVNGEEVDQTLAKHAKTRSTHNTYFTFPVIFLMLSNHFASVIGHPSSWLLMALFIVFGASMRHLLLVGLKASGKLALGLAALTFAGVLFLQRPAPQPVAVSGVEAPSFQEVRVIIANRCTACHSLAPVKKFGFTEAPKGRKFDTPAEIQSAAELIKKQAVEYKVMPLGNLTNITDEERATLGRWVDAGAPLK